MSAANECGGSSQTHSPSDVRFTWNGWGVTASGRSQVLAVSWRSFEGCANLAAMPVLDAGADVAVTLQVVEHLWDLRGFLRDCARLLRPGGLLVVTTPNRPVFSPGLARGEKPTNPFHVEELDAEQLHDLLVEAGFVDVVVQGLHHGPRITTWETEHGTGIVAAQVAAVLGTGDAPGGLDTFAASVTSADFGVGGHEGAQDLVAVAVRP